MDEHLQSIDKLFKDNLDDHEDHPSENVWRNIDKNLDNNKVASINKKYNNLKRVAAVLLIFTFSAFMYALYVRHTNKEIVRSTKKNTISSKTKNRSQKIIINTENNDSNNTANNRNNSPTTIPEKISATKIDQPKIDEQIIQSNDNANTDQSHKGKNNNAVTLKNEGQTTVQKKQRTTPKGQYQTITMTNADVVTETLNNNEKGENDIYKARTLTRIIFPIQNTITNKDLLVESKRTIEGNKALEMLPMAGSQLNINSSIADKKASVKDTKIFIVKTKTSKQFTSSAGLSFFFSPEIATNRLQQDKQPSHHEDDKNEIKNKEKNGSAFSTGMLLDINIGNKLGLQTGLVYSSSLIKIEPEKIYARPDEHGDIRYRISCSSGYTFITPKSGNTLASGDSVAAYASKNTLQYLDIPLSLKYKLGNGKLNFIPSIGISANILLKGKMETAIQNGNTKETETINNINGLKKTYFSALAGLGIQYNLTKRISFILAPNARVGITSINKDAPVKSYSTSLGAFAGLRLSLN